VGGMVSKVMLKPRKATGILDKLEVNRQKTMMGTKDESLYSFL
jgi:hypothetical protein